MVSFKLRAETKREHMPAALQSIRALLVQVKDLATTLVKICKQTAKWSKTTGWLKPLSDKHSFPLIYWHMNVSALCLSVHPGRFPYKPQQQSQDQT